MQNNFCITQDWNNNRMKDIYSLFVFVNVYPRKLIKYKKEEPCIKKELKKLSKPVSLTLYFPMFPLGFWCFQEHQKGTLGSKGLRARKYFAIIQHRANKTNTSLEILKTRQRNKKFNTIEHVLVWNYINWNWGYFQLFLV